MIAAQRFIVMSVPGSLDDGSDTSWFVRDLDTERSVEIGRGERMRLKAYNRVKHESVKAERVFAAERDTLLAPLREQRDAYVPGAELVYTDTVRESIRIGQIVCVRRKPFRIGVVVGFGTRDARFRVCVWSGLGERRRFYAPRLVDVVHPLTRADLTGRHGANVRAAKSAVANGTLRATMQCFGSERTCQYINQDVSV